MRRASAGANKDQYHALKRLCSSLICERCEREGCELKHGRPRQAMGFIIDCDRCHGRKGSGSKIADCVFVEYDGSLRIAVAELKSGDVDPVAAIKQIQATLSAADELLVEHRIAVSLPVLVHRRGLHSLDLKVLSRMKVSFRGLSRLLLPVKSGTTVRALMERYASHYSIPQ